jgi:hypothetical protein
MPLSSDIYASKSYPTFQRSLCIFKTGSFVIKAKDNYNIQQEISQIEKDLCFKV